MDSLLQHVFISEKNQIRLKHVLSDSSLIEIWYCGNLSYIYL